jgi:hypothetical protein
VVTVTNVRESDSDRPRRGPKSWTSGRCLCNAQVISLPLTQQDRQALATFNGCDPSDVAMKECDGCGEKWFETGGDA